MGPGRRRDEEVEEMTAPYEPELQARFGHDLDLGGEAPDDPWIRQVLLRRTHRRYDARPVPEAVLRLVLAAASSASSKSDYQLATIIRVDDRGQRDRLAALIPDMPWIGNAPAFLVFCGDPRRLERISKHPVENGTLEGFFNATVDAALALQTATLAAETLGLGTCPISVLRNHIEAVGAILALPDKVFPVAGLCLGYPAQQGFISMRLPPDAAVHRDRYDDSAIAAIDAYDQRRDARHSLKDRQKSPEIFGTADFYGWSEDKARQAMSPEGTGFAAWLKKRGFDLTR
jgi:FMN reductase [NAD(P)H]